MAMSLFARAALEAPTSNSAPLTFSPVPTQTVLRLDGSIVTQPIE